MRGIMIDRILSLREIVDRTLYLSSVLALNHRIAFNGEWIVKIDFNDLAQEQFYGTEELYGGFIDRKINHPTLADLLEPIEVLENIVYNEERKMENLFLEYDLFTGYSNPS
jgi:hypothetical protein